MFRGELMTTLYDQVKRTIRDQIQRGVYKSGSKIPSEAQLVNTLGVSAITVRRALRDLVIEGLLIGRQGRGVFVADNRRIIRSLRSDFRYSLAEEMERAGLEPTITALSTSTTPGDAELLATLQLPFSTPLFTVEKLILADNLPVCLERDFLPTDLGGSLTRELASGHLVPLLLEIGVSIDSIDYRVEGGSVSGDEATLLDLPPGFPVLKVQYVPIGIDGKPIAAGFLISRADRMVYDFRVHVAEGWPTRTGRTRRHNGGTREPRKVRAERLTERDARTPADGPK